MRRLRLLLSLVIGGIAGAIVGLAAVIAADASLFSFAFAVLAPVLACRVVGLRDRRILAKVALYAAIGWALTFSLGPASSQSAASRARRLAEDPFVGHGWLIACHAVSLLLASVGAAFAPRNRDGRAATAGTDHMHP